MAETDASVAGRVAVCGLDARKVGKRAPDDGADISMELPKMPALLSLRLTRLVRPLAWSMGCKLDRLAEGAMPEAVVLGSKLKAGVMSDDCCCCCCCWACFRLEERDKETAVGWSIALRVLRLLISVVLEVLSVRPVRGGKDAGATA